MKSRLFLKFFLVFLVTSLSVVMLMVVTMQFFVYRNFSDYVVQQELERLDGLAAALLSEYQKENNWEKFKNDPRRWHDMLERYLPAEGAPPPPRPESESDNPPPEYGDRIHQDRKLQDRLHPDDNMPPRRSESRRHNYEQDQPTRDRRLRPGPPLRGPKLSFPAARLSLFDAQKQIVFGNPVPAEQAFMPIELDNQVIGWLGLKKERQAMSPTDVAFLTRQSRAFYMIGIIVLMMAAIISVIFSRHLTSPVSKIAEGTRAIRNRRFDQRITVASNDELGQLAKDFNAMAQTLQNDETVRRQWLTDIAHELRTPLAVLRGEIEALEDGIRQFNPKTSASLHAEVMYLSKIVNDLSMIAKTESNILEMNIVLVNPVTVLEHTIERFKPRFAENQFTIQTDSYKSGRLMTMGDADKLDQVFTNIFENSLKYATSPGTLTIGSDASKDRIRIFIEDSGPGVAKASLERLFDRLYRTDSARTRQNDGSGLGLSICKSIIETHLGVIHAENGQTGGLRIVIHLPRHKA